MEVKTVYLVDVYGNGSDMRLYRTRSGPAAFKKRKNSKMYVAEVENWQDVTDFIKGKEETNDPYR
jgi:hypothetical protein